MSHRNQIETLIKQLITVQTKSKPLQHIIKTKCSCRNQINTLIKQLVLASKKIPWILEKVNRDPNFKNLINNSDFCKLVKKY